MAGAESQRVAAPSYGLLGTGHGPLRTGTLGWQTEGRVVTGNRIREDRRQGGRFGISKPINVIHLINRANEKNHVLSMDSEKKFRIHLKSTP